MAPEQRKPGFRPVGLEFLLSEASAIAEQHLPRQHAESIGDALTFNVAESERAPFVSFVLDGLTNNDSSYHATIHYNLGALQERGHDRSDKIESAAHVGADIVTRFTRELGYSGFVSDQFTQNLRGIIVDVIKSSDSSPKPEEVVLRCIVHDFGVYVEIGTQKSLNPRSGLKSFSSSFKDLNKPDYNCPHYICSAKITQAHGGTYAEGFMPDDKERVSYMLKLLSANIQVSGKYAAENKWSLAGKVLMSFLEKYDNWMQSPQAVLTRDTYGMMHQLRDEAFNLTSHYLSIDCAHGTAMQRVDDASVEHYSRYLKEQCPGMTSSDIIILAQVQEICDKLGIESSSIPLLRKEEDMRVDAGAVRGQKQKPVYPQ